MNLVGFFDGNEKFGEVGEDKQILIGFFEPLSNTYKVFDLFLYFLWVFCDDVLDFQEVGGMTFLG